MRTVNHHQNNLLPHNFATMGWKQKISFLQQLTAQVEVKEIPFSPQQFENFWPSLIKQTNINVLQKTVSTLQLWVDTYGIRSLRVQRELIKSLISLSKMVRPEIDFGVVSIVIALITYQKRESTSEQRVPLSLVSQERFNSFNNPTFFFGLQQSETMQEQKNQNHIESLEIQTAGCKSWLLGQVVESMKSCHKPSFLLCLRIINSLAKNSLLSNEQFAQIVGQANEVKDVIEHRKLPNKASDLKDKKIDQEISQLLNQLKCVNQ